MDTHVQWDRDYTLTFRNLQTGKVFQIRDLRCEFDVKLYVDNKEKSNEASVTIYNLGRDLVNQLGNEYGQIRLEAGYRGHIKTIVEGDTINVKTVKNGTDIATTFKLAPNFRNLAIKPISIVFPEEITLGQVIEGIAYGLDLSLQAQATGQGWKNIRLPYGYSSYGTGKQVLDELCRAYNIEYRVEMNILRVNDRYTTNGRGEQAIVISRDTGMIDIPYMETEEISKRVGEVVGDNEQFVSIKNSTKADGTKRKISKYKARRYSIHVKALMNPDVRANTLIKIITATDTNNDKLSGFYRVRSVSFKGDTRGADWYMDIYGDSVEATEY